MDESSNSTTDHATAAGPKRRFPANAKGFLLAPAVWFVWFVALYSVHGAGCATGLDHIGLLGTSVLRAALVVLTLGAAITIAVVGLWSLRTWRGLRGQGEDAGGRPVDESLFLSYAAALHSALFLVAVIWIGFPILAMPLCAG